MNEDELLRAYRRLRTVPTERAALEAEQEAVYDYEDRVGGVKCLYCPTVIDASAVRVVCRFCASKRRG